MFKTALLVSLPLASGSFTPADLKAHTLEVKNQLKEVVKSLPESLRTATAEVSDDVYDMPLGGNNIWFGSKIYTTEAKCESKTTSAVWFATGYNIGLNQGCNTLPDPVGSVGAVKANCNGTHIIGTYYNSNSCSGSVNMTSVFQIGGDCETAGSWASQTMCFYGQGDTWKSGSGYSDLSFAQSECPTCAVPLGYDNYYSGVCIPSTTTSMEMTGCDNEGKVTDYNYYNAVNDCSGDAFTSYNETFSLLECEANIVPEYDDTDYGETSANSYCIANAPGSCGSAVHNGVSFGLTGLLVAAAMYFSK